MKETQRKYSERNTTCSVEDYSENRRVHASLIKQAASSARISRGLSKSVFTKRGREGEGGSEVVEALYKGKPFHDFASFPRNCFVSARFYQEPHYKYYCNLESNQRNEPILTFRTTSTLRAAAFN